MRIVGIDVGFKGAIVLIDADKKLISWCAIPYRADKIVDFDLLNRRFERFDNVDMIYIEKVIGRGGWGAGPIFAFGINYGQILAHFYNRPTTLLTPTKWQSLAHIGTDEGTAKERSMASFIRLNPNAEVKKTWDGFVDAFHIARYGAFHYHKINVANWDFLNLGEIK
jgi:hypothetical protein